MLSLILSMGILQGCEAFWKKPDPKIIYVEKKVRERIPAELIQGGTCEELNIRILVRGKSTGADLAEQSLERRSGRESCKDTLKAIREWDERPL